MLAKLVGSKTAEKVLLFLFLYNEGYARQISRLFDSAFSPFNKQLTKFEDSGILVSRMKGRTKMYTWNPRCPYQKEIKSLLKKYWECTPETQKKVYYKERMRPRKSDKPL
ncbi:MAG: ArsR family transcriptional regulator [Caldisericia bacterium]|nr:ArsR family transcriptional regulator [Caldisericia bacterium]